jgi:iron(III) transport system substrate-binding protein
VASRGALFRRVLPALPVIAAAVVLAGCGPATPPPPPEVAVRVPRGGEVTIYVEAPRHNAGPLLKTFSEQSGITVQARYRETLGDAFLDRLREDAKAGKADLVWTDSPLTAVALAREGLAEPFRPAGARPVPSQYRDPAFRWIGFAVNPRVILYNSERLKRDEAPTSIEEMTRGPWAGKGAMARLRRGPPAFQAGVLLALWGPDRARAYFDAIAKNGTLLLEGEAAVRDAVSSGQALWGVIDLDEGICAMRSAEPVHIFFPDRMSMGAVATPYTAVLLRSAPHPEQARGLFGWLFSTDAAWALGQNDCAVVTLLPDIPKPDWVPALGEFNVAPVDNERVYDLVRGDAAYFAAWGGAGPGGSLTPAANR